MRAVVQRVKRTSVTVGGELKGSAGQGFNVLIGVMQGDTDAEAQLLAAKISKLRVFEDENGKMNKSVLDIGGEILVISQFTLCADIKKGNRPSFTDSAPPEEADRLYLAFCEHLREAGVKKVETGVFAADMLVSIDNDGPVTIVMDTDIWEKRG
ncbi:MAG: D-aminoacyl-tRNA deacylase [Clostridium sp.]|jgi:D-tyrosyl-tRNA(Tyr) deacylase|nr:D-tyrosyl-tRNA(Tyr) deacylase [Clostridium sp.]MCI5841975.1 D-aminoacyl-tRNA deacylase [Clostridium sp.]MDY5895412.1 D-aminoacyl-tRNA deacylase [Oscillospiraceae bacterium]CDC09045.1 d-tyrosyl-tRNA(Tyr) deacylase [Clostridium sp. CAG:413]